MKSGETEYFGELYNRYIPLLYGVCLKYLKDEARAQDAVMELFEDLLPKVTHYEIKTFRTWIYRVVKTLKRFHWIILFILWNPMNFCIFYVKRKVMRTNWKLCIIV